MSDELKPWAERERGRCARSWEAGDDPRPMLRALTHVWRDCGPMGIEEFERDLLVVDDDLMRLVVYGLVVPSAVSNWEATEYPDNPYLWLDGWVRGMLGQPDQKEAYARLVFMLREVLGNPFGVVACHNAWRTRQVTNLAVAACEPGPDGTLDATALRALSDSLEEAGCVCLTCAGKGYVPDPDGVAAVGPGWGVWGPCHDCVRDGMGSGVHPLLAHLRNGKPHVRGCWALRAVLKH